MANVTGKRADKRTEEQRRNDAAQNARPKGTQDTAYVVIPNPATERGCMHDRICCISFDHYFGWCSLPLHHQMAR